jgi:hypothetical protein
VLREALVAKDTFIASLTDGRNPVAAAAIFVAIIVVVTVALGFWLRGQIAAERERDDR